MRPPVGSPGPDPFRRRSTLLAAVFAGAVAICWTWPAFRQLQADSYRLLYQGRWIAEHGVPYREVFTLSAHGRSFADQQWLAELIDYEAWRVAGYNGLALLSAGAFASGFALLAALMRRRGASVALAASCATLAILGTYGVTFVRAQVFALPLFVALVWLCLEDSQQPRLSPRLVFVVPLLALWANLHGSVLIGAALAGAYVCCRVVILFRQARWRSAAAYGVLAVAIALTPMATPYGAHVLVYYQHMIGNPAIGLADVEWGPPALTLPILQFAVPLLLALASVGAALARGRRPPWVLIGMLLVTGVAAAMKTRDNLWLALAASLVLAETASSWLPSRTSSRSFLVGLSAATAGLAGLGIVPLVERSSAGYQSQTPLREIAAVASYAASHPCARVLADNTSASALLWLDPRLAGRVAFDGELEAYPPAALERWVAFEAANTPGWLGAAHGYQILVGTTAFEPGLVARLARLPRTSVLGHDTRGIAVLDAAAEPSGCPAPSSLLRAASEVGHA